MSKSVTISRRQLVDISRASIKDARVGVEVPLSISRRLMKVARTTPTITGDWRHKTADCGCLVGTFHGAALDDSMITPAEQQIGQCFLDRLTNLLGVEEALEVIQVAEETS